MRFLLLLALLPVYSPAADFQHRNMVAGAAFASTVDRPLGNTIWFSSFSIEGKNAAGFLNSSNMPLLTVANTAISAYDAHITYDISNFYKKDDSRLKIVSNTILQSPNTIYSIWCSIQNTTFRALVVCFALRVIKIALQKPTLIWFEPDGFQGISSRKMKCYFLGNK